MKTLSVGLPHQNAQADLSWYGRALELLQPPSWYNWKFDQTAEPHYVPMLWRLRNDAYMVEAIRVARLNKRRLWFLSNEPERKRDQGGSDVEPSEAADAVALWKRRTDNPIAAPGILWDAWGQKWLEQYLQANGPMPDYWAVHIYAHSAGHWLVLWEEWREWMRDNALELPTIVTEFASWSEDVAEQKAVMNVVNQTLRTDSLLHSAYWFSARYAPFVDWWARSDLLDADDQLTELGEHYVSGGVSPATNTTTYLPSVSKT